MPLEGRDTIQKAIISKVKEATTLVADNRVREWKYQAPDIGYPCLRVRVNSVIPDDCKRMDVRFTVSAHSESSSSKSSGQIIDEVVNGLHEQLLTGHGVTSTMIYCLRSAPADNRESLWADEALFGVVVV